MIRTFRCSCIVLWLVCSPSLRVAHGGETTLEPNAPRFDETTGIEWGSETNGWRAGAFRMQVGGSLIKMWVRKDAEPRPRLNDLFFPTNNLPGPMTLIGPDGKRIPLAKKISDDEAFPKSIGLNALRPSRPWSGFYNFIFLDSNGMGEMCTFDPAKVFRVKADGPYELTIHPVIYVADRTNKVWNRLELPPIQMHLNIVVEPKK